MGKRLFLSLLGALAVCGGVHGRSDDQPPRSGTKAGEIPAGLLEALHDKEPSVRLQAAQMLVQMGGAKTALPVVEELLKAPQEGIRLEAATLLKRIPWARLALQLKDPDPSTRLEAAQSLWQMGGAAAKEARSTLLELLTSPRPDLRFRAALILTQRGGAETKAAIPVLVDALKDPQARV